MFNIEVHSKVQQYSVGRKDGKYKKVNQYHNLIMYNAYYLYKKNKLDLRIYNSYHLFSIVFYRKHRVIRYNNMLGFVIE